jgi:Fe-S cluster assembly ATPase SufC
LFPFAEDPHDEIAVLQRRRSHANRDIDTLVHNVNGSDVDAMKLVAEGVNALRSPDRAFLVITHYQRLLDHIRPDVVHIMADGRIVQSGGPELALEVETNGYGDLLKSVA